MKDTEIIKALECCIGKSDCLSCPCEKGASIECLDDLHRYALDLINRRKAEIEQLKIENRILSQKRVSFPERLEVDRKARAEAIKEFAEKLRISFLQEDLLM